MDTIVDQLKREVTDIPTGEWPDVVIVHNEGVILPFCTTCQSSATYIRVVAAEGHSPSFILDNLAGSYSLVGFHLLLMHHLHHTILTPPDCRAMYSKLAGTTRMLAALNIAMELQDDA